MNALQTFFTETHPESYRSLGVFYPTQCLIVVVNDMKDAEHIKSLLLQSGLRANDLISVEGREVVELEAHDTGLGALLMQKLSRGLGCEQVATDQQLELAEQGKVFVIAHCPSDKAKDDAWRALENEKTILAAHYYGPNLVDHLLCESKTH